MIWLFVGFLRQPTLHIWEVIKMSRSKRHTSKCGICKCDSEKSDKKIWHQRMRAAIKQYLHATNFDEKLPPHVKEVSNVWAFGKDGKSWFNQKNHPDLMRK